jgi:hypothetical protein
MSNVSCVFLELHLLTRVNVLGRLPLLDASVREHLASTFLRTNLDASIELTSIFGSSE